MVDLVTVDGQRCTPYMAYQLGRLKSDFRARFGMDIYAVSGIRLDWEQINIFLARYVTAPNVRGRYVYDTRVWNGTRYYRISSAGTVAVPGTSNHEIQGNSAAWDFADSGSDAGVSRAGSERSNWLRANAWRYDLEPEGFNFNEAWHYKALNIFNAVPGGAPAQTPPEKSKEKDMSQPINFMNPKNGVTYTLIPGVQLMGHVNGFGDRLTQFVNEGVWPGESLQDRYNAGLRNLNSEHVDWMLPYYGFARFNSGNLPAGGIVVLADHLEAQRVAMENIFNTMRPGETGVRRNGQLWDHIAQSGR